MPVARHIAVPACTPVHAHPTTQKQHPHPHKTHSRCLTVTHVQLAMERLNRSDPRFAVAVRNSPRAGLELAERAMLPVRSVGWWVAGWVEACRGRRRKRPENAGKRGKFFCVITHQSQISSLLWGSVLCQLWPPLFSSSRERLTWLWPDDDGCPLLTSPSTR